MDDGLGTGPAYRPGAFIKADRDECLMVLSSVRADIIRIEHSLKRNPNRISPSPPDWERRAERALGHLRRTAMEASGRLMILASEAGEAERFMYAAASLFSPTDLALTWEYVNNGEV